jgi:hypothetical protein
MSYQDDSNPVNASVNKVRRQMTPMELCQDNIKKALDVLLTAQPTERIPTKARKYLDQLKNDFELMKIMRPQLIAFVLILMANGKLTQHLLSDEYLEEHYFSQLGIQVEEDDMVLFKKNIISYYDSLSKYIRL